MFVSELEQRMFYTPIRSTAILPTASVKPIKLEKSNSMQDERQKDSTKKGEKTFAELLKFYSNKV